MAEVHVHVRHLGHIQHVEHQADYLDVAGRTGVAIELGAELDRAARSSQCARTCMQDTTGVAQPTRPLAMQTMRIHTGDLRRDIRTEAHQASGGRIGHLEGAQSQILGSACQQGFQVFDMRGDDEFVAPALEQVQHLTAGCFDARRLRWQHFFDPIWQQPAVYRCHVASPLSAGRQFINESSKEGRCRAACCPARQVAGDGRRGDRSRSRRHASHAAREMEGCLPVPASDRMPCRIPATWLSYMNLADAKKPGFPG
ncbi:hypothetical protein D3C81_1068770 [compost metagenome]